MGQNKLLVVLFLMILSSTTLGKWSAGKAEKNLAFIVEKSTVTAKAKQYFGQNGVNAVNYVYEFLDDFVFVSEEELVKNLSFLMLLSGAILLAFLTLTNFVVGYGRHSTRAAWVPMMWSNRASWFLQEIPSFLFALLALYRLKNYDQVGLSGWVAWLMFTVHYFQRSCIYTYLMKSGSKGVPVHIFVFGFVFCSWNGYIQSQYHLHYGHYDSWNPDTALNVLRGVGVALYVIGFIINVDSDRRLRGLRKNSSDSSYKIPYGGLFEFISCPNYFGENVEWFGYALFAQSLPAWAFAFFTFANTFPRAIQNHKWYLNKFKEDYPRDRKIFMPFIY
ncbi:unnamed protein product [Bursaphelenchus xylophilus]|uniref:(pine wood nematode) hypothetical protein n=1 Tax=Bursaphelenchus xylophilus TaxID=6326 RepID=A0A1I7SBG1_BURXY|nr:unnamed protein product [Bursaphelenchus xylophilus]CAG9122021.1 unnamed protein product [Bursaphelenchus xylophilus]